ncbi:arylsulfatase B-like isoform X1 [Amblyomma americanum]
MILLHVLCLAFSAVCAAKKPPHIILIMADDVGWADTSLVGSRQIPTPNLDALAAHGILLSSHYTLQTCTPSRAALLTGLYPIRIGLQHAVMIPAQPGGMDPRVPTMAERLKGLGYVTHALGKWHLGYSCAKYLPTRRGFDTFYGYYNTAKYYFTQKLNFNNMCGRDYWDNEKPATDADGTYDTNLVTDRVVDIISSHDSNKPLFIYLASLAAHGQTWNLTTDAPQRNLAKFPYIGDHNRTLLAGAVDALDESVGRIVAALHQRRMLANSVLVFTSDNGGIPWGVFSNTGSNWPLRGTKGTMWEGGVRLPAVVWSPLLVPGSRVVVPQPMHVVDWLPTLYSAAGGSIKDLGVIDGIDLWPALSAAKSSKETSWPRSEFLINFDTGAGLSAYRDGNYKLVAVTTPTAGEARYPFDEPGLQRHVPTPGGMPPDQSGHNATELLNTRMKSSLAWRTLKDFYGDGDASCLASLSSDWREQAAIRCESNNEAVPGLEELREGDYLFDIAQDPCELKNLAQSLPSVVAKLSQKLNSYASVTKPPATLTMDPAGLPFVNDCIWPPWEDRTQTAKQSCSCP